jgi:hypothetical protein
VCSTVGSTRLGEEAFGEVDSLSQLGHFPTQGGELVEHLGEKLRLG